MKNMDKNKEESKRKEESENSSDFKKVEINWFKIKDSYIKSITKSCYKYKFKKAFKSNQEYYREVAKRKGVSIDDDNRYFISFENLNHEEVKKIEEVNFYNLDKRLQEKLLSRTFKEIKKKNE